MIKTEHFVSLFRSDVTHLLFPIYLQHSIIIIYLIIIRNSARGGMDPIRKSLRLTLTIVH